MPHWRGDTVVSFLLVLLSRYWKTKDVTPNLWQISVINCCDGVNFILIWWSPSSFYIESNSFPLSYHRCSICLYPTLHTYIVLFLLVQWEILAKIGLVFQSFHLSVYMDPHANNCIFRWMHIYRFVAFGNDSKIDLEYFIKPFGVGTRAISTSMTIQICEMF